MATGTLSPQRSDEADPPEPNVRRTRRDLGFLAVLIVLTLVALFPLYGILIPINVDLQDHTMLSKLFWEKVTGTSRLDIEVSGFLGYKLSTVINFFIFSFCSLTGIPLLYFPKIVAAELVVLQSVIVAVILRYAREGRSAASHLLTFGFALPAVVSVYSACYFMGFVGFQMSVIILLPAVFFTERLIQHGGFRSFAVLVLLLALVYAAHPFGLFFWAVWCAGRFIASIPTLSIRTEWKTMPIAAAAVLPVLAYHMLATAGSEIAPTTASLWNNSPFVTMEEWNRDRLWRLLDGIFLKGDDAANASIFAIFALGFVFVAAIVPFVSKRGRGLRSFALSSVFFLVVCSWINEKFIPTPGGHWLAYEYRFSTSVYAVCLVAAAFILLRSFTFETVGRWQRGLITAAFLICVLASAAHLLETQKAYARFDPAARNYLAKVFEHKRPSGTLPPSRWYPNPSHLRRYKCLIEADCNPPGTPFWSLSGDLYPIKMKSRKRIRPPEPILAAPVNAFESGEGYGEGQLSRPRGIASDSSGNFYVADTGNSRVQKFTADGTFVMQFGEYGTGKGQLSEPIGLAVDSETRTYVVDAVNNKMLRFRPDGSFDCEWFAPQLPLSSPLDVAIGPNGNLYISEQSGDVKSFDPKAGTYTAWGAPGPGAAEFNRPTGIAAGSDFVYVADSGNNRVQVFAAGGKFVREWEIKAWDRYVWHFPDLTLDEAGGRLYISSGWSREVLAYSTDGELLGTVKFAPDVELNNPAAVTIGNDGQKKTLYVLSFGSDVVDSGDPGVARVDLAQ